MPTVTARPLFFLRYFWKIGIVLLAVVIAAGIAVKLYSTIREDAAARADAELKMRKAYPDLKWAFDELDKCNQGEGDYAKNGYATREQCDLAILALGRLRGIEDQLASALRVRDARQ